MTIDLATLAFHELYTASDSVLIGDSTCLSIANIGSFTLTSLPTPLLFTNVLHVPVMSKNLILVYVLCADNPINVLFFYSFLHGVYYWPKLVPLWSSALVPSSLVRSSLSAISICHSHLGHPSLYIFFQISKCSKYFLSSGTFMFLFLYLLQY